MFVDQNRKADLDPRHQRTRHRRRRQQVQRRHPGHRQQRPQAPAPGQQQQPERDEDDDATRGQDQALGELGEEQGVHACARAGGGTAAADRLDVEKTGP